MSKPQHTPGPWHAGHIGDGRFRVFDSNHGQICDVTMPGAVGGLNAGLIASAPALLAALEEVVRHEDGFPTLPYAVMVDAMRSALRLARGAS